jgi:hypothetical protein
MTDLRRIRQGLSAARRAHPHTYCARGFWTNSACTTDQTRVCNTCADPEI